MIPCFNEASRLDADAFMDFIPRTKFDIIFCNDGSTDRTTDVIQEMMKVFPERIFLIDFKENRGKAECIRQGLLQCPDQYETLGYLDADLATSLDEMNDMLTYFNTHSIQLLYGSRIKKMGSRIDRTFMRHVVGRIFATITSHILHLPTYDTQCGAKIFSAQHLKPVFSNPFISRWFFDIEIVARYVIEKGYLSIDEHFEEYPLKQWTEKGDSRIKPKDFLNTPMQLFKIHRTYKNELRKARTR